MNSSNLARGLCSKRASTCFQLFRFGKLASYKDPRFSICMKYHGSCANKLLCEKNKYLQSFGNQNTFLKVNSNLTHLKRLESTEQSAQNEKVAAQMNMKLLNENSFLSWCRNAYLSTAVGLAMISETTTNLGQTAGAVAIGVGSMNVFWGTSCHVVNLLRLRHVTGMSGFTLFLNIFGSMLHCCLWLMVLVCYIGFVDETRQEKVVEQIAYSNAENESLKDI